MRRKLTKQEKFDIDLFYRPYLIDRRNKITSSGSLLYEYEKKIEQHSHLRVLEIFSENFSDYFKGKDKDEFYLFLSDYGDLLNWKKILLPIVNLAHYEFKDLVNCIDSFKEYLNSETWGMLSRDYKCYENIEFLRKFKDKLDWEEITKRRHWNNLELLLEFKDYVDVYQLFKGIDFRGDIKCYIMPYLEEHFEDIIKYAIQQKKSEEEKKIKELVDLALETRKKEIDSLDNN